MLETFRLNNQEFATSQRLQRARVVWALWLLAVMGVAAVIGLYVLQIGPATKAVSFLIFTSPIVATAYRPRYGLYSIMFFALLGDSVLWPWYPFVKNFSSAESILYINDALIMSPMECYVLLVALVWLGKGAMQRKIMVFKGELFWPAVIFTACLLFGLVYGLGTGGNTNVALWEVRPIFLLPAMLVLCSNLLEEPAHVLQLIWFAMFGIAIEGIVGAYHYLVVLGGSLAGVEAITEHSSAIHMNTLFVFAIGVYLFHGSWKHRVVIPLMAPAVLLSYLATQRRAAFLTLGIALVFVFVFIYRQHRTLFWMITPVVLLFGAAYLGVFWNSERPLAMPASAVRSIVAPDTTGKDYDSNLYRMIENVNVSQTIHDVPLTGVGFGNKLHIIVPMPDISFFIWWEYIAHNSVLWFWIKTGVVGFLSMLFLVGFGIMNAARALWELPNGPLRAATMVAALYIMMHFLYAYVDMSWDTQSMLYVGAMLGVINCVERVARNAPVAPPERWPWMAVPLPRLGRVRTSAAGVTQ